MSATHTIAPSVGHPVVPTQGGIGATPGYDAVDIRRLATIGMAEGAININAYKVSERGAGTNYSVDVAANAGGALVMGDASAFQSLYYVAPDSAVVNLVPDPADATNPRVDAIVLRVYDDAFDGSGLNTVQLEVLTGTPTGGASLSNLTGAPAVPNSALLLANVLIPASASVITNVDVLDRRPFAQGLRKQLTASGSTGALGSSFQGIPGMVWSGDLAAGQALEFSGFAECAYKHPGNAANVGDIQVFWEVIDGSGTIYQQSHDKPGRFYPWWEYFEYTPTPTGTTATHLNTDPANLQVPVDWYYQPWAGRVTVALVATSVAGNLGTVGGNTTATLKVVNVPG